MFPEGFIKRIQTQKYIDPDNLLNALQEPSPVSIRINPSKWGRRPLDSEPVPWCSQGFYLPKRPSFTLDPLFHSGCYYPQEASGMFIEEVFRQAVDKSGYLRILDVCGAPGGKSTHLSSLTGYNGLVVANEVIKSRASILAENISKWGINNTIVTQNDPSVFSRIPGFFDVILADAPCSGEGMFRDPVALREWSEPNAIHCSERQKRILADIWPALRENGLLIYSTCTFNQGENEENIKWLLDKTGAETFELDISGFEGIKKISYHGINGYGFYPGMIRGEGLFISVVRKTGNSSGISKVKKSMPFNEMKKSDHAVIKDWTLFPVQNIFRAGEEIFAFPGRIEDYSVLRGSLRIISNGTKICTVKNGDYLPAHEFALSDRIRKEAFPVAELDYSQAIAFLRRDAFNPDVPKGWFLASYKGINLGFCNNIGKRINNYFPVQWRIRMPSPEKESKNIIEWGI